MPIPLALIPLIASGVGAASKGAMAAYQNKMANKVAKPRPTYTRPGEVVTAEALAANAYNSAGDTRLEQQAIDNSVANSAYQLGNSGNSSATNMAMIAALNANANRAKTTAVLEGRQRKDQLRGNYQQQLSNSAQYTDKEFQVSKFEPYQNAALAAQQLKSAAGKNMAGAIKDLIAGGLNAASGGLTSKLNPTIAGSLAKLLEKGDMAGAKEVVKAQGFSDVQADNVLTEISKLGATPNLGEVVTPTNPELLNRALPKEVQMPAVLSHSLKTSANQQDIVQPIIGTTKNAIESVVTPESMKTMFDGLSTQESEGVLSDMIGKLRGLVESKGITPEQFKQAVSELEAAAKSKTKQEAVKKVIKTVAPLAALIK